MKLAIALVLTLVALTPARAADTIFDTSEKEDKGTVIPLGIESGAANDRNRDTRVFTVPAVVSGEKGTFTWTGSGQSVITASFANKISAKIADNEDLKGILGGDGKPVYLGDTAIEIEFGGKKQLVTVFVLRDGVIGGRLAGVIGFDVAKEFQWELDPRKPQLTLRHPGAPAKPNAVATVPLTEDNLDLMAHVKVRGVEEDVSLQPNATYFQAAEKLQQAWQAANVGKPAQESTVGGVRIIQLMGEADGIAFSDKLVEQNIPVILLADGGTAKSGLGAAILNRFVYSVDPTRKELTLVERVPPAAGTTKPAAAPPRK